MMGAVQRAVRLARRHGLWLTALLTVAVFFGLFLYGDTGAVLAAMFSVDAWRIAAVLILVTGGYGVRFLKWEYYLRELDIRVATRTSLVVFVSGLMMAVTPGKAGEVWKAWFLRDLRDVPVNRTVSVVGAERVTDTLALAAFTGLGLVVYEQSSVTIVVVTAIFLIGIAILQWRSGCLRLLARLQTVPVVGAYAGELESFYNSTYRLFRPRPLVVAFFISLIAWGLEGVALWIILSGFGAPMSVLQSLFVFGLGSVVGAASLLPGGLAAAEASMVGMLVILGTDRTVAVSATLIIRIGTLWYGAILGTLVFLAYRFLRGSSVSSRSPE